MRTLIICLIVLAGIFLAEKDVESSALPPQELSLAVPQAADDPSERPFLPEWSWVQDSGIDSNLLTDQIFLAALSVLGVLLTAIGLFRGK